jgi:transcriptional regulator with XRE-family HTH domain
MAKKNDSDELSFDEKVLERVENSLRRLAVDGDLDLPVADEILKKYSKELPQEIADRMWKRIRAKSAMANRFRVCPGRSEADVLPFPELLRTLRTKAGVSAEDFAQTVRLTSSEVSALEEGRQDPLKVSAGVLATLMEVCWLPISVVERSLKRLLAARAVRLTLSGVSARSGGEITDEEYDRALQDIATHMAEEQKAADKMELPSGYLEALRSTLKQRGRTDLL